MDETLFALRLALTTFVVGFVTGAVILQLFGNSFAIVLGLFLLVFMYVFIGVGVSREWGKR
jgi:hypothetical protein